MSEGGERGEKASKKVRVKRRHEGVGAGSSGHAVGVKLSKRERAAEQSKTAKIAALALATK